jgi:hypothetical protein
VKPKDPPRLLCKDMARNVPCMYVCMDDALKMDYGCYESETKDSNL